MATKRAPKRPAARKPRAKVRIEHDLLGELAVPADAYYGVQTARGLENFHISGVELRLYPNVIKAFAMVKLAAARANYDCGGRKPTFSSQLRRINDRLTIYTPSAFPSFSERLTWVHRWNTHLLASRIKGLIQKLTFERYILGLSWPLWVSVLPELKSWFSYYDCSDDYLNYPGLRVGPKRIKEEEEKLLRSVDLVFCSAQKFKETKSRLNSNCFLVRNGVDLSFMKDGKGSGEAPSDLRNIRGPIVGYMGTIGPWLDFDALVTLAGARPDWSIVMIGPVTSNRFLSPRADERRAARRAGFRLRSVATGI